MRLPPIVQQALEHGYPLSDKLCDDCKKSRTPVAPDGTACRLCDDCFLRLAYVMCQ